MVSELCLGTMTWGTQNTEAEAHAQIELALERGVTFWDTAEMYPTNPVRAETVGRTEEIIGAWFASSGRRGEVVLATKITGKGQIVRPGEPISGATMRRRSKARFAGSGPSGSTSTSCTGRTGAATISARCGGTRRRDRTGRRKRRICSMCWRRRRP